MKLKTEKSRGTVAVTVSHAVRDKSYSLYNRETGKTTNMRTVYEARLFVDCYKDSATIWYTDANGTEWALLNIENGRVINETPQAI